jgi:UDP-glucose 4-epimerase
MKTIAITGAAGYIGRRITEALAEDDSYEKIVGIDIHPLPCLTPKVKPQILDIRHPALPEILLKEKTEGIIHSAWTVQSNHNFQENHSINIGGLENVLRAARLCKVKQVIHISSTTVYGAHKGNWEFQKEESPLRPVKGFVSAEERASAEGLVSKFQKENLEVTVIIVRACTVIGPSATNLTAAYLKRPKALICYGYNPPYQLIHEDDLTRAILLALKCDQSGTFNLVGDKTVGTIEMHLLMGQKILSLPFPLVYGIKSFQWHLRLPGGLVPPSFLDYSRYPCLASDKKAKKELGFIPLFTARDALLDFKQSLSKS